MVRPSGREPRTATPLSPKSSRPVATVAPITAINTPGKRLLPLSSRIMASVVAPMASAATLMLPDAIAVPIAHRLRKGPSASMENPRNLGSWLISTINAMPFM